MEHNSGNTMQNNNDSIDLFVPGRLCLFGEHSDWAGQMRKFNADIRPGQAIVVCTKEGIYASAKKSDKLRITSLDINGEAVSAEFSMKIPELEALAQEGGFFSYIAGVAAYMLRHYNIGGLELICHKTTLPQKKGLSSSAAICTLTAKAFNRLYGLGMTTRGEMECAFNGEQLTPSRCGRLDQAVAFERGVIHMEFNGDKLDVSHIKIGSPLYIVFADLKSEKDTIKILSDLNTAYPYPQTNQQKNLHSLFGTKNEEIITEVISAFSSGDSEKLGELMTKAQAQFDIYAAPLSPKELAAPKLHSVIEDENIAKWSFGAKGVGSGGDGTVQFIAKSENDMYQLRDYLQVQLGLAAYTIIIPKTEAIKKAVIPLGGYGTRMFPATKSIQKELLPIIDKDGLVKPSLLVILEDLVSSGIEEICLVIRPENESIYRQLLSRISEDYYLSLSPKMRKYEEQIETLRNRVSFAYQTKPLGFGHAVLQSREFADGEPVLLLLGDHLFTSNTDKSVIKQLLSAYEQSEQLSLGLFEINSENVSNYGIAKIDSKYNEADNLYKLDSLYEKPPLQFAQNNLCYNGKYYGIFIYVITEEVYLSLDRQFKTSDTSTTPLQLTPSLDEVTHRFGATGCIIDGKRFDIGLPNEYKITLSEYGG
jgi:UTP-glucose-1-phosphate uridylyltransferase/mevalonate kinase